MDPIINHATYLTTTFRDWQKEFQYVYREKDKDRTLQLLWTRVLEDASQVGEAIREERYSYLIDRLAHTFCWVISFINKLSGTYNENNVISVDDLLWYKYPGICYRCLNKPCTCGNKETEDQVIEWMKNGDPREAILNDYRRRAVQHPGNLLEWSDFYRLLYGNNHAKQTISQIGFHFLEEIGEVSRALRYLTSYTKNNGLMEIDPSSRTDEFSDLTTELYKEIADTISWSFSLLIKLTNLFDFGKDYIYDTFFTYSNLAKSDMQVIDQLFCNNDLLALPNILWVAYKSKEHDYISCPICKRRPCICTILDVK